MKGDHLNKIKRKDFDFSEEGKRTPLHLNVPLDHSKLHFEILNKRKVDPYKLVHEIIIEIDKSLVQLDRSILKGKIHKQTVGKPSNKAEIF